MSAIASLLATYKHYALVYDNDHRRTDGLTTITGSRDAIASKNKFKINKREISKNVRKETRERWSFG